MKKNLSRKRKRNNSKNNVSFSKPKKPSPPKSLQLNGFELLELSEKEELNPIISIDQNDNITETKSQTKEDQSSSKEYTRLRGKARNVEMYYIIKQGDINIKENCFNCLMTDFNANELLYFNNRKDLIYYLQYCFLFKKRLLFFDKNNYLENKNEIMRFGNSFLNGWKFFIPKTMCKSCFLQMINKRLFTTHIKSIFSDTDKNSLCKTNYRDYALFNPKFRSVFSLTKRIPNKRRGKNSRKLISIKKNTKNQRINVDKSMQIDTFQKNVKIKKPGIIINPDVIFNENNNTFIINKKILGDISIVLSDENKNNVNDLNKGQKIYGINKSIIKSDVKEKDKQKNNKKREVLFSKTNTKNSENNFIFNAKNKMVENEIMGTNFQISEKINVKIKENFPKFPEPTIAITPFSKSIIEQNNSFFFENNFNDENMAKCINLCIEQIKTQILPLVNCILLYLNNVRSQLLELKNMVIFINISIRNYTHKLLQNQAKIPENIISYTLNDFKSFYKAVENNTICYRRYSVISELLFQKTSENLLQLVSKLKKNGNNTYLSNIIDILEKELEQINLNSIFCNEKIEESIINFADNFRCFFALVSEMG